MKLTGSPRCLFVYGTLRRGERHHALLGAAPFLGRCRTAGRYTLFHLGRYPAAMAGGRTAIVGEVYALNKVLLARLDRLEDYPREYVRAGIVTPYGPAWIYLYRRPPASATPVILSGDWRFARRPRSTPSALRRWVRPTWSARSEPLRRIHPGSHDSRGTILSGDHDPRLRTLLPKPNGRQANEISENYG